MDYMGSVNIRVACTKVLLSINHFDRRLLDPFNLIQDECFSGMLTVAKRPPLLKICQACPTMIRIGTVIPISKQDPKSI